MLDWNFERRHYSPQQGYITGDVLFSLIERGWHIRRVITDFNGRAKLHVCTMERDGETMLVRVLDGPVVQVILNDTGTSLYAA